MNTESFLLRENPIFEIIMSNNEFEIKNGLDKNDNAIYKYQDINSFNFQTRHINWIITIFSFILEFIGFGLGDTYKEKNLFKFDHKDSKIKILLTNCDMHKAELISKIIKSKLN